MESEEKDECAGRLYVNLDKIVLLLEKCMKVLVLVLVLMLTGCTTKQDVICFGDKTYIFNKGVENFYIIDQETKETIKILEKE